MPSDAKSTLRVLLMGSGPADACVRELERASLETSAEVVRTREEFEAALREGGWDLIVADWNGSGSGAAALAYARERVPATPLVALLEPEDERSAVECIEAGAFDFLFNDRLVRLRRIAAIALEQKRLVEDRERIEKALKGSEERWRMLIERSLAGMFRSALGGRILDVNPAAVEMLGFPSRAELLALNTTDVVCDAEEHARLISMLACDGAVTNAEIRLKRKDGSPVWALANLTLVEGEAGARVVEGTLVDLTERKRAEEKILRLNRLYSVLTHICQAVVRIGERRALLEEVCRIAVEDGGFRMACYAEADAAAGKLVPLVCNSRSGEESCRPAIDFEELARGEGLLAWRAGTLGRGHRTSAAFAIRVRGRLAGSLVFYGSEPGLFDSENMQLLEEIADNVAFALESMEREAERQFMEQERTRLYVSEQAARLQAKADARYRELLEAAPDAILEVDAGGRILVANEAAERIFGYPAKDMLGQPLEMLLPERYRDLHQKWRSAFLADPARSKVRQGGEVQAQRKDGAEFPVEITLSPVKSDVGRLVTCTVRDITIRKQAESALRESNRRTASILESITDAFIALDSDWKLTYLNRKAEQIMGCRREDAIGKNIWQAFPELAGSVLQHECEQAAATRTPAEFTSFYPTPRIWAEIHVYPGENGLSVYSQDITARKHLEDQFRQAQKLEALGRLAGGVAHDFNNLLTIIGGYGQMLMDVIEPRNPLRKDVEPIVEAALRASALTRQLLAFSRRQMVQPKILDLNRLVNRMTKMLHRVIGEDIRLTLALAPELGRVKADPGQVEQVVMNLAINARDAMLDGGRLQIETSNLDLVAGARAGAHADIPEGSYVVLSIADTGTGMTEDVRSHIFEPFFTTKPKGKGTGLGLSTVYGIVKQSGGEVAVETHPGEGTVFRIYLPRLSSHRKTIKVAGRVRTVAKGSEKVLLVEDEPEVRRLTRSMLRRLGYTVVEAPDGPAALKAWRKHGPSIDLLLTDVIMPNMSGRQLAEKLSSEQPGLKVLYMSGYTDDVIAHHGVIDSDKELLQKPFSRDLLAEKIRKVLEQPAARDTSR